MSPVDEYASETYDEPYVAMPARNNSTVPQVTKVTPAQMLAYSKALNQGFDDDDDFDDIE